MALKVLTHYGYLNEIKQAVHLGLPFPIRKINLVGTRKSGKTENAEITLIDILLLPTKKTMLHFFRLQPKDAVELFDEILDLVEPQQVAHLRINKTKRTIRNLITGSELRVHGILSNRKGQGKSQAKLGLKKVKSDYIIVFWEEAHEINFDLRQAILEALRGAPQILEIAASNPWSIKNEYIAYCNLNLRFDLDTLNEDFQQFSIIDKGTHREVFHYTRWELNPFLSEWERNNFIELREVDPRRARIAADGMPGMSEGAIYTNYLDKVTDISTFDRNHWIFRPDYFVGGVDWGSTRDATSAGIYGVGENHDWIAGYDNYRHQNKGNRIQKNNIQMAVDIVDFYEEQAKRFPIIKRNSITVFVEYMAHGMIDVLIQEATNKGIDHWLNFIPCSKIPIAHIIDITTVAMGRGMVYMDFKRMKWLMEEFELAVYEEDKTDAKGQAIRLDQDDHSINDFEYAMGVTMYNLIKGNLKDIWIKDY